jgi:CelD/BcsL family acetyltransferase involved in cellulose biosynthesis
MQVHSEILTDAESFATLAREWDELIEDSDQRCYFLRWQWNFLWWTHLAPSNSSLRIVVCRAVDGTLVGLCPFYVRQRQAFYVIPIRELAFLGTGGGLKTSEHLSIAVRSGYEELATRSMAAALNGRADWDRLSCSRVLEDSSVLQAFMSALAETATLRQFELAPYIDTTAGWTGYKSSLGRSMRRNVEYYARRLFKRYQCEFQRVSTEEELVVALEALVALHIAQWQSRGEIGTLSDPTFQRFLSDAAKNSLQDRRLRVWTLRIDGQIEAVLLAFVDAGVVHYFQQGHNTTFEKDDIGTVLISLCIRDCCDDPSIRAFDFMGGGASYKQMWARQTKAINVGEVSRNNPRSRAFDVHERLLDASRAFYRAITPMSVRALRRDWLKARNARTSAKRLARSAIHALAAISTGSLNLMDLLVADLEVAVLAGWCCLSSILF